MIFAGQISFMDLSGMIAFGAGILSFFSPCVLPLVPSYLIFISGITFDDYIGLDSKKYRKIVLIHSISFIFGFSLIFISLGFSSSLIGNILARYQTSVMRIGGLILILMGLFYLNIIKIPLFNQQRMIQLKDKPVGIFGSFIVGITFSLGWTPCVGPVLSSILIIASTSNSVFKGAYLLSLYSLGMAVPFILSAILFDRLFVLMKRYGYVVKYSPKILGILLIIIGVLLVSSLFTRISLYFGQLMPI